MTIISSVHNRRVVDAAKLHQTKHRQSTGLTLVEGRNAVSAAFGSGVELLDLFVAEADDEGRRIAAEAGREPALVTPAVLARLAGTETPVGPIAVVRIPEPAETHGRDLLLMVGVADPGNAGTLVRSAAAFGFAVATVGGADVWSPKAIRSGAGAHFQTPIAAGLDPVAESARPLWALTVDGTDDLAASDGPVVLAVGSEAHGLPEEVVERADRRVRIPMAARVESLNAAVAGSIAMYEVAKSARARGTAH